MNLYKTNTTPINPNSYKTVATQQGPILLFKNLLPRDIHPSTTPSDGVSVRQLVSKYHLWVERYEHLFNYINNPTAYITDGDAVSKYLRYLIQGKVTPRIELPVEQKEKELRSLTLRASSCCLEFASRLTNTCLSSSFINPRTVYVFRNSDFSQRNKLPVEYDYYLFFLLLDDVLEILPEFLATIQDKQTNIPEAFKQMSQAVIYILLDLSQIIFDLKQQFNTINEISLIHFGEGIARTHQTALQPSHKNVSWAVLEQSIATIKASFEITHTLPIDLDSVEDC